VVHLHWPNPGAVLAYLASGHRGRLVITYHSDIIRQKVLRHFFDQILRHALSRADAIIVSSSNYLESSYILPLHRKKCRVIPFGISIEQFQRPDASVVARIRKQFGPRIVLGVGRLVYYKGFEHLIEAMKSVKGRLLIIGNGPLHRTLRQKAAELGLGDRVTFLTDVRDVIPYYHAADVFVLSSIARSEAFGIVQLEAMACGKPVINTNLDSGVPSVSLDRVSGLTVPPADSTALARAINGLLDNALRSTAYGRTGQLRVKQHFTRQGMARRTLALYHEVIDSSRLNGHSAEGEGTARLTGNEGGVPTRIAARVMTFLTAKVIET
jgi:glycosyltransferase involved in cell wall biosynthesis